MKYYNSNNQALNYRVKKESRKCTIVYISYLVVSNICYNMILNKEHKKTLDYRSVFVIVLSLLVYQCRYFCRLKLFRALFFSFKCLFFYYNYRLIYDNHKSETVRQIYIMDMIVLVLLIVDGMFTCFK